MFLCAHPVLRTKLASHSLAATATPPVLTNSLFRKPSCAWSPPSSPRSSTTITTTGTTRNRNISSTAASLATVASSSSVHHDHPLPPSPSAPPVMTVHPPNHVREPEIDSGDYDTTHSGAVRKYLRTYGLVPPAVESYATQAARCLRQLESKPTNIEKYQYLSHLRATNVHLFYRLAIDHMRKLTPLIYTPVVGEACLRWSEIYTHPEGLYLSYADRGNVASVLANWPQSTVDITVITDGSRILGLGDLGVNGMGIPVGKLSLYCACGGIRPDAALPITLDMGTGNKAFREDPLYLGSRRERVSEEEEMEFLDELMEALVERWPGIVIQFEDFKNPFPSLEKYAGKYTMFNDDIQGTGAVVLAGVINAVKVAGVHPRDQRCVVMGAGSAAVGVAKQIVEFFISEGLTEDEARQCFWLVDTKGMVTNDRGDRLAEHKKYFSRADNNGTRCHTLPETVDFVRPTMLLGLSTIGGCFDERILTKMGEWNERPIIFPLSNPSANSECTFEEAMRYTGGRAVFASGSPFPALELDGRLHVPGQGNNMYVFPAIGLGSILSKATTVTQSMIYASATSLAASLSYSEHADAWLYPDLARIREVSVAVTAGVIRAAQRAGVDREVRIRDYDDEQLEGWIKARMYDPHRETANVERDIKALVSSIATSASAPAPASRTEEQQPQAQVQAPAPLASPTKLAQLPSLPPKINGVNGVDGPLGEVGVLGQ